MIERLIPGSCYEAGPTACMATPKVLRSLRKQLTSARVVSSHDYRVAAAAGLVRGEGVRRLGFNDGVFYPPMMLAAAAAASPQGAPPMRRVSLQVGARRVMHAMALLVDFPDNPGTRPAADIHQMLFDENNPGSMRSIYRELSGGLLDVGGECVGYVRAPHPYTYYTAAESGTGNDYEHSTPKLVEDALAEFCKSDALARFDADGDGFVDGLFVIHAGGGAEAEPDVARRADMIWSHKWTLRAPFTDGKTKVYAYSTEPEDGRVGVFAHEFGHVLGLPDLYDTDYRSSGVGEWCLMGGGSWGGGGDKPTRMSCWCLATLGWIRPKVVRASGPQVLLPIARARGASLKVQTSVPAEYFLLENRRAEGRDESLPGGGLLLWHVNEARGDNTNPRDYKVGLVQADGDDHLNRGVNTGDAGDPFPGATGATSVKDSTLAPNTSLNDGTPTGFACSGIKVASDGTVRLAIKVPGTGGSSARTKTAKSKQVSPKRAAARGRQGRAKG